VERVAALPWNQWQDSPGIGGSFAVEYAEGGDQRRNPHADEEEPEAKTPPKAYSRDHLAVLIDVYSITAYIRHYRK
jgi:hypothetical protein